MKQLLYIFASFLLLASSCGEKECGHVPEVPEDFLKYWYFEEGSWWVYKHKDTTLYDSVRVVSTRIFIHEHSLSLLKYGWGCRKNQGMSIEDYNDDPKIKYAFESYAGDSTYRLSGVGTSPIISPYLDDWFFSSTFDTIISDSEAMEHLDTFYLDNGTMYTDVIRCFSTVQPGNEVYFASGVGIIKGVTTIPPDENPLLRSFNLELIDYEVNPKY